MEELKIVEVEEIEEVKQTQLIIVKQLPIIEQHLKALKEEVSIEVATAKALVCTADTIQSVKKTKSGLAKKFKALEVMRKEVKSKVMNPYQDFEKIYKECVTDQFKDADSTLKVKIAEVEDKVKAQKKADVKAYFEEYISTTEIDFIEFERIGVKVGLSGSLKSLKAVVKSFIDIVVDDLALIDTQEHKTEILVAYKQSLNCSLAITTVVERFKKIEEEEIKQAELKEKRRIEKERLAEIERIRKETEANIKPIAAPIAPPIQEKREEVKPSAHEVKTFPGAATKYSLNFTVIDTKEKLVALRQFLNDGGYKYEQK